MKVMAIIESMANENGVMANVNVKISAKISMKVIMAMK
jgi:hypothetical protein